MAESRTPVLVSEVVGALLMAFIGLLIGAWFTQSSMPTLYATFAVPLTMTACVGYCLIKDRRADRARAMLYGGIIAWMGLAFILL